MDWYTNNGKSGLIRDLMAKGFSVRKSEKAVNAFFAAIAGALHRGEPVDIPGLGQLRVQLRQGKRHSRLVRVRDIHTRKVLFRKIPIPGRRRVILFSADPDFRVEPPDLPPSPPISVPVLMQFRRPQNPELHEAWKLAAERLKHPVDTALMDRLQAAADQNPYAPGALLPLLRQLRRIGFWPPTVEALEYDLANRRHW